MTIWIQKTSWKTWKMCPGLFKHLFIDNNPPSDSIELQFGRLFHAKAKDFFGWINLEELSKCKTAAETTSLFADFTIDQPVVKRWVENFKLFEVARWLACRERFPTDPLKYWMPIALEEEVFVEKTGQLLHIDRLGWYDEFSLINVDYKASKTFDARDLRQELTFYNIGINASKKWSTPCLYIGCLNPMLNLSMLERVGQRTTTAVYKSVQKCRADIIAGNYPFKPSIFCRWCVRLNLCLSEGVLDVPEEEEECTKTS